MYPPSSFSAISRPVTGEDASFMDSELSALLHFTGLQWILVPEPQLLKELSAPTAASVMFAAEFPDTEDKAAFLCQKLAVTGDQVREVEVATRGQRMNPHWASYRKGRITSSNIGPVPKSIASKRSPPKLLLKSLLSDYVQVVSMPLSGVQSQ